MSYAKEYDEALSRLNAPERSPLPYAPIPYGPVPNYCNYANWNRIMFETRQGNLPKYSIMQRCSFDEQNIIHGGSPSDMYYRFTLDPSFKFAKGDRKSIAIREVNIRSPIDNDISITTYAELTFVIGTTRNGVDDIFRIAYNISNRNRIFSTTTFTKDVEISLGTWSDELGNKIYDTIKNTRDDANTKDFDAELYQTKAYYKNKKLIVEIALSAIYDIKPENCEFDPNKQLLSFSKEEIGTYLNTVYDKFSQIVASKMYSIKDPEENRFIIYIEWDLTNHPMNYVYGSMCADFNPWTSKNVISGYSFQSDSLTKLYPYNGNDEVKFWFLDINGDPCKYHYARGYVDLELIIDNSNSFAMDA